MPAVDKRGHDAGDGIARAASGLERGTSGSFTNATTSRRSMMTCVDGGFHQQVGGRRRCSYASLLSLAISVLSTLTA